MMPYVHEPIIGNKLRNNEYIKINRFKLQKYNITQNQKSRNPDKQDDIQDQKEE